jgi:hypothetical protein
MVETEMTMTDELPPHLDPDTYRMPTEAEKLMEYQAKLVVWGCLSALVLGWSIYVWTQIG